MKNIYIRIFHITAALVFCLSPFLGWAQNPVTTTFAGSGTAGFTNGTGIAATFSAPSGIAIDASGNTYVSDPNNHVIRKITSAGVVTTFAGSGTAGFAEGTGSAAQFNTPMGLTMLSNGFLLVADMGNHRIRSISSTGVVTTFAGSGLQGATTGTLTSARFNSPTAIAVNSSFQFFVADKGNNMIRIISGNSVTGLNNSTSAGLVNGAIASSRFNAPQGIAVDANGNVYVSEAGNHNIRKISNTLETVSTFAGTGAPGYLEATGPFVVFNNPNGLAIDGTTGNIYVADQGNNRIRVLTAAGVSSTWAGLTAGYADGTGNSVLFNAPSAVAVSGSSLLFVADQSNNRIRKITNCGLTAPTPTITASGPTTFCSANGPITLTASTSAGYLWSTGETTQSITVNASGNYSVQAIAAPCTSVAGSVTITINPSPTIISLGSTTTTSNNNLVINGTGFSTITSVIFGEIPARFTINSSTQITAIVPRMARTGKVSVSNANGCKALSTSIPVINQSTSISFTNRTNTFNNINTNTHAAPTFTDLDGDGLLDLIVGKVSGYINHYEQASANSNSFTPITPNFNSIFTDGRSNPTFTDIDGDGLLDMIVGKSDGYLLHYEQASVNSISFNLVTNFFLNADVGNNSSPTFTDLDGDGLLDFLVGGSLGRIVHYEQVSANSLSFNFITTTFNSIDNLGGVLYTSEPTFTDIDGDGKLDFYLGGGSNIKHYVQNAVNSTSFTNINNNVNGLPNLQYTKPTFNDINGDGLYDMLIGIGDGDLLHYEQNPTPFISSLSANAICSGSTLTITGSNFSNVTNVSINGTDVGTLSGVTSSSISFVVPTNVTSGNILVTSLLGNSNSLAVTINTPSATPTISGATAICSGNSTTLTTSYTLGTNEAYLWSNNSSAGTLSVSAAGTYSLRIRNTVSGCTSAISNTIAVTQNPTPGTPTITGSTSVCSGSSTTLSTSYSLSTNEAFLWSNNSNSNTLSASEAGTYSLRIRNTVTGCTSAVSNAITVTVTPLPTTPTISGTRTITAGGNTTLTSSSALGNIWSTGATTQSITTSTPGTYTLQVVSGGCTSSTASVIVTRPFNTYQVSTFAGSTTAGFVNETGTAARFNNSNGINRDANGNFYVTDVNNHSIRKITPAGVVTTLAGVAGAAGFADGTGATVRFSSPHSVAADASGNIYVADQGNHCIRKITPSGTVSTFAGTNSGGSTDGALTSARFNLPSGIVINAAGEIFVADYGNNKIRKISADGTTVSTLAGSGASGGTDGTGTGATFNGPSSLALDGLGNIYAGEIFGHRIRKITPTGVVTTLAGTGNAGGQDGAGNQATFFNPGGITCDEGGNVFVVEYGGHRVRKITAAGVVSTIGGNGIAGFANGNGTSTQFSNPQGIVVDANSNLFVADRTNHSIRKMVYCDEVITPPTISGTRTITSGGTTTLTSSSATGYLWSTGETTQSITVNSPGTYSVSVAGGVCTSAISSATVSRLSNNYSVSVLAGSGTAGFNNATGTAAQFNDPWGICKDAAGNLYTTDPTNSRIRKITPAGVVTTFAGSGGYGNTDGPGTTATFNGSIGIASDNQDNLYVTEYFGQSIRKITPAGVVTTFAGGIGGSADGTGAAAQFNNPTSVAVGPNGNVYVTDQTNNRIRQITPAGVVTTLAGSSGGFADGTGTSAQFSAPTGIAVDFNGNIFVADYYNNRIRRITPSGVVTTFAGSGTASSTDGTGTAATFHSPRGIVIDGSGTLFVTCEGTDRIRRITNPGAVVTTIAGANTGITVPNSSNAYIFNNPAGLTIDANGVIYQTELSSPRILKLTPCSDIATPTISGSNVICSGTPIVLTSSSATGNIWSTGETTQSITVSSAGTYSVLVASNGCASPTASKVVTATDLRTNPRTIAGFTYFTTIDSKDYYKSNSPTTWSTARTNCIAAGGDLASLETEAEWTAVRTAAGNSEHLWIGLSDATVEGQFQWVSGNPFNYVLWNSGEPNNFGGDEDFISLSSGTAGLANDFPTSVSANAILEVSQTSTAFSNSPVIAGNSLTFSAPTVAGATYAWTGPNGFTSTAQNPTISAASSAHTGNFSVTISLNGCTRSITLPVVVTCVNAVRKAPRTLSGFTYGGSFGKKDYYVSNGFATWDAARTACQTAGGDLVSIETAAEWDVVKTVASTDVWIGLSDATTEGTFQWVSGAPTSFTSWNSSEPNNFGNNEDHVIIRSSSTVGWNDFPSTQSQRYILEIDQEQFTTSNSPVSAGSQLTFTTVTTANTTYSWSGPNGYSSTAQSPSITIATPQNAGQYILTSTRLGCERKDTIQVVVNCPVMATPTISGTASFCVGGSTVLTSSSSSEYIWSTGETTQSITVSSAGSYSVRTIVNGCTSAVSNSIAVTATNFNPTPRTISGFTYSRSLGNKDYYISNSATNWTTARAACIAAGGDLVSIETETEWNTVVGINTTSSSWIGLTDAAQEGTFRWVTGALPTYTFWHPSNPDNYAGNEDYVGILTGAPYYWNDFSGNENHLYILEISKQTYVTSNSPITAGSQLSFTTGNLANTTYSWTGPNGFTSTAQSPSITVATPQNAGQYILTSTRLGCEKKDTLQVVVNCPAMTTPAIIGATEFCSGSSILLNSGYSLGANEAYLWSDNSSASTLSVSVAGTYSLRIRNTVTGCTSAVSNIKIVSMNSLPSTPTIAGASSICSGNSTSLTTTYSLGTNEAFLWSNNSSGSTLSVSAAGTYSLRIRNTVTGCTSALSNSITISVSTMPATPTISGNSTFCFGTSTVLTSSAATGNLWSNGEITQSITVLAPGTYTVRQISGACTTVASASVVTSTIASGTWLGTTTDWNNSTNWCGGVPNATTDITLPISGTLPAISGTIATCRNLTIPSGVTLNIGNGANFNLVGNLSGLGNIAGVSGSSLSLVGTTSQTIQRVNVGTLVVNNSSGVTLGGNITLSNGITLTNGVLNTGNNNLILLPNAASPTETANSYVIGNIRNSARVVGTGSVSMFGITIAAGTDNLDTVMIERGENPATYNGNQGIGHIWKIRAGNQPVSGRQITLSWNSRADNGKDITRLQVYRRPDTGGEWIRMGNVVNGSSRSITLTTNSFSDWTVSDQDAPLPVTLTSFTGKATQFVNQLNWTTSSEVNNQGFNVERSTDGKIFTKIGFVKGFGTTNTKQTYQFTDVNLTEAYYRLQQVDFDGKSEYSGTIKVGESNTTTQLEVFPNPAIDKVNIRTNGIGTLEIVNNLGQVVITQSANRTNEINISKLAMGVYTVKFNGVSQKLVVR